MISEIKIALRYFLFPKKDTPKLIPRAGMIGLALSITVLLTTLSVMNGFDSHIKEKVISRMPHISSPTLSKYEMDKVSQDQGFEISKVGEFYQTRLLVPKWQYVQVHVFISGEFDVPTISSSLAHQFNWNGPSEINLWGFTQKKIFGKSYPHSYNILFE